MEPPGPDRSPPPAWPGAAVALAAIAVFAPALQNGFIDLYDDNLYVVGNAVVKRGLDASTIAWAFTTTHAHNWHPLTWLSHLADVSLFGLAPWGHHLSSVLLHAGCAALVFALARSAGLGPFVSSFAAAAFALHPLRVQSVAWVAERKDVLSGLFALATLLLWLRWARAPSPWRYAAALAAFALGLLAKPMLVTLPGVLLLLDLWPLRRAGPGGPGFQRLVLEKIPFGVLAAASAAATLAVQTTSGAVQDGLAFPLADRLANAAVSPYLYVAKTLWPSGLAVFYPHRGAEIPAALGLAAAAGLAAISVASWRLRARAPWLFVGWGWFLVTLLPVVGLVQAGRQGLADRYTYLPMIGPVLAVAAAASDAVRRAGTRGARTATSAAGTVAIALAAAVTITQIATWRDSATLFRHAAEVTERNALAENGLGVLAAREGRLGEALERYARAVEFDPGFGVGQQNYAALLLALGRVQEAAPHAAAAAQLMPSDAAARYIHGASLATQGRLVEAAAELESALALRPDYPSAHAALAQIRAQLGSPQPSR